MGKSNLNGAWGEALAAKYLHKKRYKIIATNYRSRFGEIDLIVADRKFLVFVEVKLRKTDNFAKAQEFVDRRKQEKLRSAAALYISQKELDCPVRFDVVSIIWEENQRPKLWHAPNAFTWS